MNLDVKLGPKNITKMASYDFKGRQNEILCNKGSLIR